MNTVNREDYEDVEDYISALYDLNVDLDTLFQKAQSGDLPALRVFCNNYIRERLHNLGATPRCGVPWVTGRSSVNMFTGQADALMGISERLILMHNYKILFHGEVSTTKDHDFLGEQVFAFFQDLDPGTVHVGFVSGFSQEACLKCEFIVMNASRERRSISGLLDYSKDKDLIERYLLALLKGDSYRMCRLRDC